MSKTMTQIQADQLEYSIGLIPIGKYINSKTKREYKCNNCNKVYLTTPGKARIGN